MQFKDDKKVYYVYICFGYFLFSDLAIDKIQINNFQNDVSNF